MNPLAIASDVASFLYNNAANIIGFVGNLFREPVDEAQLYEAPYVPPFQGGQCTFLYDVSCTFTRNIQGIPSQSGTFTNTYRRAGKIGAPQVFNGIASNGLKQVRISFSYASGTAIQDVANTSNIQATAQTSISISSFTVTAVNGVDNCGNLSNPNNPNNINDSGLAKNGYPNLDSSETLVEGIAPLALSPSLAAALAALAGATAAGLGAATAAALAELAKQIGGGGGGDRPNPDGDNPDDTDGKPERVRFTYGLLRRDGYLNLYPQDNNEWEGIYLDILVEDIPPAYGKYFGSKSPNYYEYRRLGHIVFVSPTFTSFGFTELRFRRNCIPIPSGAIGFAYHLGLDGAVSAVAIGYYNKYLQKTF